MNNEVIEFSKAIGATDLKSELDCSEYRDLFKRRNYFILGKNKYMVIKVSRNKIKPFYGFGEKFVKLFNFLTEAGGNYYFVALITNKSGWVLSKNQIMNQIANGSLSYSPKNKEYKINNYNLKDKDSFTSIDGFLRKIEN